MKLNKLSPKDFSLFNKFLSLKRHNLSNYALANILIWKGLFEISWIILDNNLCIFFKDSCGTFMYLPPLGCRPSRGLIEETFKIMDGLNKNRSFSRIDNVEEYDLSLFYTPVYKVRLKSNEYLYERERIVSLKGKRFKSKRGPYNYFLNHYKFSCRPLNPHRDKTDCLNLSRRWLEARKKDNSDILYRYMLEDSFNCQKIAFDYYKQLSFLGHAVKVNGKIKGYTLGFEINKDTFCVLFEITDRRVKGISQFIFRHFSSQLNNYKQINVMDDSGLDNLKRVKLSYRPFKLIPSYTVLKK